MKIKNLSLKEHWSTTYGSVFEWFSTHTRDWPMKIV